MAATPWSPEDSGAETPAYWNEACVYLAERDPILGRWIATYGLARLRSRNDAFATLARSIVGQQISVKAAQSVWDRLLGQMQPASPQALLALSTDTLRSVGMSARKVEYLRDLARHCIEGKVHTAAWAGMDDEAIIKELVAIRGIGRWTAEMFLIFHLMRPDVLPLDDIGLLRGISQNYLDGAAIARRQALDIASRWAPYRSVATWYIWRSLDPIPVEY
ncbi:DNA-3-methyladenine glycosylase family protein [Candidatus Symbiobacter mobilis]|uniref:DNA-3-methyladenine glycosylase II n=1 Tax=Candidatus Symbiobacter mobilis CR TaxID=946483 RepID=U5N5U5_9BURK|nr:DNA-3-methyladenine glycosylase [Candidatus Symbiobacter mobilis]AGX86737.1 DNA-3-methyladenine glycosylase II [Candidatus Symbiobacter mobilis CR]